MAWRLGSGKSVSSAPKLNKIEKDETDPLPSVRRDFYLEHPDVTSMTAEQANEIRTEHSIRVYGDGAPNPVSSFLQASFPQYMLDTLSEAGFTAPTAIQRQGWPVAMSGRDIIALAETGSGKTLTYLLPAIVHVNAQPVLEPGDGPLALVLAPTRELALQIHEECVRFGHPCGVRTTCIYGGVPKPPQILELKKAPEIIAATPGRLADMLSHRKTELSRCTYLAIDEADRMLDLGFEPQLQIILLQMRSDRQTLMFSATWPPEVQALAEQFLSPDVITVEVGGALADAGKANAAIKQTVLMCTDEEKFGRLVELLEEIMDGSKILVFASSKRRCDELTRELRVDGWPALAIHGDKSQEERDWVLHEFKEGTQPLLIATDVAQRGLDIKEVRFVVNYDCPDTGEAYVHRIGRTGRAGDTGTAFTLVTPDDKRVYLDLVKVLRGSNQEVPAELETLAAREQSSFHRSKKFKFQ